MDQNQFIETIKAIVAESNIKDVESVLSNPPGRAPAKNLIELSLWYNRLDEHSRSMVKRIIEYSTDSAVFGLLCVLDNVRTIESSGEKGMLQLYFEKDGNSILLNGADSDFLHDLFNTD